MDRGIRASLSPNEARTLCRIAADMAPRAMLAARDVAQLLKLRPRARGGTASWN